jgi:cytochrome c553
MGIAGLIILVSACGKSIALPPDPFAGPAVCSSAVLLHPDEQPSETMAPGRACISCHSAENAASGEADAPIFSFAGTAYPTGREPDNCVGSDATGAIIEVTDARGITFSAEANEVGNFFAALDDFKVPYTARIRFQGQTREMVEPQTSGDCNSCHGPEGGNPDPAAPRAPGRVLLP